MTEHSDDRTRTHTVLVPGTMVQQYRIIKKIGAGGMGEVYLAEDTKLTRKVALKFLPVHLVARAEIRMRFVREVQTIAKLNHPNIVGVYDVSEFDGRPFYVMELVEGESLHHYCHEKPLPVDLIIEYAIQICQGLGEAHRAGIIHRDIKPANIALDKKGRIRLIDFGLAAREGDDRITRTGSTLGTVSYMSPEQVSGRDIDHRSDLFSLGIVLYELIAGRTPFKRDNEGATLKAIIEDAPEPLTRYKADVPEKLQEIVMELLEKDKELRYQSAEGVIADLKRLMYDSQQSGFSRTISTKSRKKLLIVSVVTAIVLCVAAVWYVSIRSENGQSSVSDDVPMIAVLPFENLGESEDDYFADGMTDEIISRLAGIKGLGVISGTSALKYKTSDKTLKEFGHELGVDYVIEGTVRWSKTGGAPRIRITPQLVRVSDERHLWADNYERDLLEVFSVQAEIAAQIVDQLGLKLLESDRRTLSSHPTENARAYEYYLRGVSQLRGFDIERFSGESITAPFDSAVMLDSNFALAHALRSQAYSITAFVAWVREGADQALESAEKALELDPNLPQAHIALGTYYNLVLTDYDRALEQFKLARSELHSDPDVLAGIALVHLRQGRFQEAQEGFHKAAELDPLSPQRYWSLAHSYRADGKLVEADKFISRAIALAPGKPENYILKAEILEARFGEWEPIDSLTHAALEYCDTLKFAVAPGSWELMDRIPEINLRDLVEAFEQKFRQLQMLTAGKVALFGYASLANAYDVLGDTSMSMIYLDSCRQQFELKLKESPDDPHHSSSLGLVLAQLGECDSAVEYGLRGKELLSVKECHW